MPRQTTGAVRLEERCIQIVRDHLACVMSDIIEPLFEWEHRELLKALGRESNERQRR